MLFAAVGSIMGSGWLVGALNASQLAGPAAFVAWALGGLMILLVGLTYVLHWLGALVYLAAYRSRLSSERVRALVGGPGRLEE